MRSIPREDAAIGVAASRCQFGTSAPQHQQRRVLLQGNHSITLCSDAENEYVLKEKGTHPQCGTKPNRRRTDEREKETRVPTENRVPFPLPQSLWLDLCCMQGIFQSMNASIETSKMKHRNVQQRKWRTTATTSGFPSGNRQPVRPSPSVHRTTRHSSVVSYECTIRYDRSHDVYEHETVPTGKTTSAASTRTTKGMLQRGPLANEQQCTHKVEDKRHAGSSSETENHFLVFLVHRLPQSAGNRFPIH